MIFKKIKELFVVKKKCACACSCSSLQNSASILAIEDDLTQQSMIKKTLEKNGYRVSLAEDGEKGFEAAKREKPDLILLDVVLPGGMNGQEVCKRLKADEATQGIPVIFLTSINTPGSVVEHFDLGAEMHLSKPISAKELISQVEITLKDNK